MTQKHSKHIKAKILAHLKEQEGLKVNKAPTTAHFFMPENAETELLKESFEKAGIKVTFVGRDK
jgi:hypothetical protein